jgi:S-adenosylmethionine:tRNA ribosyltransferase-isomerase
VLEFDGSPAAIWAGIARHGQAVQYAHVQQPLALWDTWTPIAGSALAFEPPSASFVLDWQTLSAMRTKGVRFATITHAAGLSSTGDPDLDALLPLDELPHPGRTAAEVRQPERRQAHRRDRTVARSSTAARRIACGRRWPQRIGRSTRLRVVNAILSGTHEPGSAIRSCCGHCGR